MFGLSKKESKSNSISGEIFPIVVLHLGHTDIRISTKSNGNKLLCKL